MSRLTTTQLLQLRFRMIAMLWVLVRADRPSPANKDADLVLAPARWERLHFDLLNRHKF